MVGCTGTAGTFWALAGMLKPANIHRKAMTSCMLLQLWRWPVFPVRGAGVIDNSIDEHLQL